MWFCHQSLFAKRVLLINTPFDISYKMSADLKFIKENYNNKKLFLKVDFPISSCDIDGISNTNRNKGLKENIKIVKELDRGLNKLNNLFHLYFVVITRSIRGKK